MNVRSALAGCAALAVILTAFTPPAYAADTSAARIRALQARLSALQRRYAQQEQRIDRLQREFEAAFGSHPSHVHVAAHHIAQRHIAARPAPAATPAVSTATTTTAATTVTTGGQTQQAPGHVAIVSPSTAASPTPQLGGPAPKTLSQRAVYQQENAIFNPGVTITPGLQYSFADNRLFTLNGFLALGAIFLGNIDVTRQQNTVAEPNVTADFTTSKRSQFELTVPFVWRASTYDAQGAQNSTSLVSYNILSAADIGDISAGYYYAIPPGRLDGPEIVLNAHLSVPTGSAPYGIKIIQDPKNTNLSYPNRLPTGTGVYTVSAGATVIQPADPAILFAGLSVYHNFIRHFSDISTSPLLHQPGRVDQGDAAVATLGTAFALNDRVSATFSVQDTLVQPTQVDPDGQAWQKVIGSELNAAVFNMGTTYSTSPTSYWQVILGIGMTQDAPNYQLNFRFPQSIP
jgi:hypothetical protein